MRKAFKPHLKALLFFALLLHCSSLHCQEKDSTGTILNNLNRPVIERLNAMDSYWEESLEGKAPDGPALSVSSSIKNARISYWSLIIAFGSALIALLGACVTCGTFILQFRLSRRQKKDISNERHENRLFGYIQQYHSIVRDFEMGAVGHGRPVFNYLFYEYQMLMDVFGKMKIQTLSQASIDRELLSSICISFIINGVTDNANCGEADLIYKHYRDDLSMEDYDRMKAVILKYRGISDEDLTKEMASTPYTLFVNYGPLQLVEHKNVRWFYGCRAAFIPYVKTVGCMMDFTRGTSVSNREEDMRVIGSAFSDHELGVLYAFAHSRENDRYIDSQLMDKFVDISSLPSLYDYKTW